MAHLKSKYVGVMEEEHLPVFVSIRKGTLKPFGGPLVTLYEAEDKGHSRQARHRTKKDFRVNGRKDFRPWQRIRRLYGTDRGDRTMGEELQGSL